MSPFGLRVRKVFAEEIARMLYVAERNSIWFHLPRFIRKTAKELE